MIKGCHYFLLIIITIVDEQFRFIVYSKEGKLTASLKNRLSALLNL
ncbi:MAG: hypothetical protein AAFZ63_03085 [Bacteroidota bacterium]